MKQVIVATKNKGKVKDFELLLASKGIAVKSLLDFSEDIDVEETGATFRENAILKAEAISKYYNKIVIADDSGLSVDALQGEPGVYSARYAGNSKDDKANIEKVLHKLNELPYEKRTARFHCALALASPNSETKVVDATCEGVITKTPEGNNGFGYDPIFYLKEKGKTMAQLTKEEKNEISHRAKALVKLERLWNELYSTEETKNESVDC